jgi:hypothetical protein
MQKKYYDICHILGIPTHGIAMTDEVDESDAIVCVPYELSDEQAIANIINVLNKEADHEN